MKLPTSQLSEGENAFRFESTKDAWVKAVITQIEAQGYQLQSHLGLEISLTKLSPDYYLRGKMSFVVQQTCARCSEFFSLPITHNFDVALAHIDQGRANTAQLSQERKELDINFFEGNEIDLSPVISEQFFLSIPYQAVCKSDCKGLCQCGKNLNAGLCNCVSETPETAFAMLGGLKIPPS